VSAYEQTYLSRARESLDVEEFFFPERDPPIPGLPDAEPGLSRKAA
jgi:hypothetical protein